MFFSIWFNTISTWAGAGFGWKLVFGTYKCLTKLSDLSLSWNWICSWMDRWNCLKAFWKARSWIGFGVKQKLRFKPSKRLIFGGTGVWFGVRLWKAKLVTSLFTSRTVLFANNRTAFTKTESFGLNGCCCFAWLASSFRLVLHFLALILLTIRVLFLPLFLFLFGFELELFSDLFGHWVRQSVPLVDWLWSLNGAWGN